MTGVEVAVPWQARCGEGPVWDPARGQLLWVDILAATVQHTDPVTLATETTAIPTDLVGAAAPRATGGLVLAVTEGFAAWQPDAGYQLRAPVLDPAHRMNDAAVDPSGRLLLAGSVERRFAAGEGVLWALDERWDARPVLTGLTQPNGIGWSPDGRTCYLIDSVPGLLLALPRASDGGLGEPRVLLDLTDQPGAPDGLTVDDRGELWIAMYGGGRLLRISPDGTILGSVDLPVRQPTSCGFAGPGLRELWVTSARDGLGLADDDPAPDGSLLRLRPPAAGTPRPPFHG